MLETVIVPVHFGDLFYLFSAAKSCSEYNIYIWQMKYWLFDIDLYTDFMKLIVVTDLRVNKL